MQTEEDEKEDEEEAHKEEEDNDDEEALRDRITFAVLMKVCPFHGDKQLLVPCIVGTIALRCDTRGNQGARNTGNTHRGKH